MATSDLAAMKCVPCRGGVAPLTREKIEPLLAQIEGWDVEADAKLEKTYRFENFVKAVEFVNALTVVAEEEGHHPDLYLTWGAVTIYLWTHKIDGLAESDFYMAAKLDKVFKQMGQEAQAAVASA